MVTAKAVGLALIVASASCCDVADTVAVQVTQVPAEVMVSPSSYALAKGESYQLSGVVKDAMGYVIPGLEVTWSSENPSIAAVDEGGTVKGLDGGTTQITGVYGSLGDLAAVTVTESVSPPPESTGTPFFSDGFETGDMSMGTGGFKWASNNRTSVVRDDGCAVWNNGPVMNCVDNNIVQWENGPDSAGRHALRFRYAAGEAWSEQRFTIGSAHSELWASWWLRVPINFKYQGTANNKLFMFWMDNYSAKGDGSTVGMEMRGDGNGGARWYGKVSAGQYKVLGGDQGSVPFISYPSDQGRWMRIVVRMKAESSEGAADGVMEVWRRWEGESTYAKTHELTSQPIRIPASGPDGFTAGYLMGWANAPYAVNTEFLLDDFAASINSLLEAGSSTPPPSGRDSP